ncbi:MAG: UvrD-helicase domain-containing protein [Pirellulales bacterium]
MEYSSAQLTEAQHQAVQHVDGPLLIIAGPGSGKTRVVTHRIAHLKELGIAPRSILALTFTNKAADEMKSRLQILAPAQPVWVGTFHRFCARTLRRYAPLVGLSENYTIYDTGDSLRLMRNTLERLDVELTHFTPEQVLQRISAAKNDLMTAENYQPNASSAIGQVVARVYPEYQKRLLAANAVDFDDLLVHMAMLLRDHEEIREELDERYRYILVDEYQDTNFPQYAIVHGLSRNYQNLAVTGDPDQSIFGWRGANINNILGFEKDFPDVTVVRLEQNYRSTKSILRAADKLIGHNTRRKQKQLFTDNDEGQPVRLLRYPNNRAEAEMIAERIREDLDEGRRAARDFAILYRTNALSRQIEFALRDRNIPYQMVNGLEFFQRREIKDVLAYLQLINNPRDDVALLRVINLPPRGIGRKTIQLIGDHAARYGLSLLDAARESGMIEPLAKRSAVAVAKFVSMIDRVSLKAAADVEEIIGTVLSESDYHAMLNDSGNEEDQERLANIEELLTVAREYDQRSGGQGDLEGFLEETSLVADTDAFEGESDRVTLMTLHASKGLEFPVVYIIAFEEKLLPHERSLEDPGQLEEERRLLFVGMTRAEEELQLSSAEYREFRGTRRMTIPSSFTNELPLDEMQGDTAPRRSRFDEIDPYASEYAQHREEIRQVRDQVAAEAAELESAYDQRLSATAGRRDKPELPPIKTAAELAAAGQATSTGNPVPIDVFRIGMVVTHPEYGLGKIKALHGEGDRRAAVVNFASQAGEQRFRLKFSPIRPAGGNHV